MSGSKNMEKRRKQVVFFGDSITSGENNDFTSYVDYLLGKFDYHKYGTSGTTLGSYSMYLVGPTNLVDKLVDIHIQNDIRNADIVVLQYGINDITSVICKECFMENVINSLVKCVDHIRRINPKVKIAFLGTRISDSMSMLARSQMDYLSKEYLKDVPELYDLGYTAFGEWIDSYMKLMIAAESLCDKFIDIFPYYERVTLDKDRIHPDDEYYRFIAKIVQNCI